MHLTHGIALAQHNSDNREDIMETTDKVESESESETPSHTYKVYSLDVWGNIDDGFEVNDRALIGTVDLPQDSTNEDILNILKEDYLKDAPYDIEVTSSLDLRYTDINITSLDAEPIMQLEHDWDCRTCNDRKLKDILEHFQNVQKGRLYTHFTYRDEQ